MLGKFPKINSRMLATHICFNQDVESVSVVVILNLVSMYIGVLIV